jgi:hypothetical protein
VNLAITLPVAGRAAFEFFDVAGRRVWSRAVDGLPPGPHVVALEPGGALRPGLYLVRLRHAGRSATTRVVLTP